MYSEDQFLPVSALQHFLYCERQCALIHLERVWEENRFTAEGKVLHDKAHTGPDESRPGVRITRGLPVASARLGLSGVCDVVEFHTSGEVLPVEYKRGRPKTHRADEVQLAAQAIALEEMLNRTVDLGLLFYGKTRRRKEVAIDTTLRELTTNLAMRLHALINHGCTPPAEFSASKCNACSLLPICLPKANSRKRGAAAWFASQL